MLAVGLLLIGASPALADPAFDPDPVEFPDQQVGTSSPAREILVTNDSSDPYEVSAVSLDGADAEGFEIVSDGCSGIELTQSNSCTVSVRFRPSEAGDWVAALVLDNAAGGDSFGVLVGGFGYDPPPIAADPDDVTFPPTRVTNSAFTAVTFTNTGDWPAAIGSPTISGPDSDGFLLPDSCFGGSLDPGDSCTVTASFSPRRPGPHTATLVLPGSGPGRTVSLSGTALPQADIQIEPGSLDFGVLVAPFEAVTRHVVVRNVAGNPVRVAIRTSSLSDRPFARVAPGSTCLRTTLAVGASCALDVSVRPASDGVFSGAVEVRAFPRLDLLASLPMTGEVRGLLLWQLESGLKSQLREFARRWHYAARATLRRRGFAMRFFPSMAGSLRLSVVHAPAQPTAAAGRLLARGRAPLAVGDEVSLRARLTRAGRKLLGRPRRLRVEAQLVFTGPEGQRLVAERHVLLRPARR